MAARMRYNAHPGVRVSISHPENRFGRLHDDGGFIRSFREFCDAQGWIMEVSTGGPGLLAAVILPVDADGFVQPGAVDAAQTAIDKWMAEHNADDCCLRCGSKDGEPHDDTKHSR